MLLLKIEDTGAPIYLQILGQIRQKIEERVLLTGEKLPSTRQLADQLGIHRSTVATAYQELWALGFIDLSPGTCPRVRDRMQIATPTNRNEQGIIDWHGIASPASNSIYQAYRRIHPAKGTDDKQDIISFGKLDMDRRLFPLESFRTCLDRAVKHQGGTLLSYGAREGFLPLRQYIARRLQSHGISVGVEEILITNGSQQGIDLVFRMIAETGKVVAIESPTYNYVLPLLRYYGMKALEIPLRHDGLDLAVLEEKFKNERPALLYTMPTFQNPTGISTGQAHRERLLSLCEEYRVPILEDGFEEEMKYCGRVVLPIKSMDKNHLVIYCGTFSKVLFPGVRIGWIAAERVCIEKLVALNCFSEISPSMVLQAGVHEFCQSGFYDRHISKMHRVFRRRMQTVLGALQQYIRPEWAEWKEPSGGFLIWLKLKPKAGVQADWNSLLAAYGVEATAGGDFFSGETDATYLRLSISMLNEAEIVEGIRRLGNTLRHVYESAV